MGTAASRISHSQIRDLTEGMPGPLADVTEELCRNINRAERDITTGLDRLASVMASVRERLASGGNMEDRGEFGQATVTIDAAIAARQLGWQMLAMSIGHEKAAKLAATGRV